jgi:hypothetical protein
MRSKLTFVIVLSFFISFSGWSQSRYVSKVDSLAGFNQSFGYGVSNLLDISTKGSDYRPSIYFDYSAKKSESVFYRVGASFSYRSVDIGNLKQSEFIPTIFTAGLENHFYKEKVFYTVGADLFYSASAKYTTLSGFKVDDMGVGLAGFGGVGFVLRNDLSLFAQTEWGAGLFREFASVGTTTIPTVVFKGVSIRSLSFGMRHFF